MGLIREAVLEGTGPLFESFCDARRHEHRAQWSIAASDSLPYQNDVRRNVPVLNRKWFAGAPHAAHDFVSDQQNTALAANCGDARGVAVWRNGRAERSANNRFKDKSGNGIGIVAIEKGIQIVRASDAAFREFLFKWTVIAEARSDMAPFGNKRLIERAAGDVAADGHGAQGAAVVALPTRDDLIAGWLSFLEMVLPHKLDRGFRGFRAPGSEVHAAAIAKIGRRERN